MKTPKQRPSAELDRMHDEGKSLAAFQDMARARRPGREMQRVNVDIPLDLLTAIDREANRIGVTRQSYIKLRLADSLPR
jgi:predicted DNA binding CopG/RHH family protein